MREVLRRRRASGGPAEEMLSKTVGIELRPRRVREALAWWESVLATEGEAGREAKWDHPDLLPTPEVLSGRPQAPQPAASQDEVEHLAGVTLPEDFDAELAKLLAGDGEERAPREDEQGGLHEPGSEEDEDGGDAGPEQDGDDDR